MRTLIIDNYDSFTYNVADLVGQVAGAPPVVVKNDECSWSELQGHNFENIIISPGPGSPLVPRDLGLSADALKYAQVPLLGVCLGHQAIGALAGGSISRAPRPVHGETSPIYHRGEGVFRDLPSPFTAARYHSLVLKSPLPPHLTVTSWTDDGLIMGLAHTSRPMWGVQFHPESIISDCGRRLIENFMELTQGHARPASTSHAAVRPVAATSALPVKQPGLRAFWRRMPIVDAVAVYDALFAEASAAYWLDSSSAESGSGRWSFMGDSSGPGDASLRYYAPESRLEVETADGLSVSSQSIFEAMAETIGAAPENAPPCPFVGGYIGCFGYETRHECGSPVNRPTAGPTALFIRSHRFIAFDHVEQEMFLVAIDAPEQHGRAEQWLAQIAERIEHVDVGRAAPGGSEGGSPCPVEGGDPLEFKLNVPKAQYIKDIGECLELIRAGETYQVCLTNEISCETEVEPLALYSVLRKMNAAPFSAFLKVGDNALLSASPERFLQVDGSGAIETKPIKGTIRRDGDGAQDRLLQETLRESIKDRAENVMIVDLLRNDLSKVCEVGTVHVPHLFAIETFATVHQMVSTVRGKLLPGKTVIDTVKATFPGGSMTGAPKIRTMEFIDRLEGRARGFYSGALGWIGDDGTADLNIVIRTIVMAGRRITIGVGGGIIARSDPEGEYEEMLLKAKASIAAIVKASGRAADAFTLDSRGDDGAAELQVGVCDPMGASEES